MILYVAAGRLGLNFAVVHVSASAVWPATGVALASLLVLGARVWPAIFVGAFVVNVLTAGSVLPSLGIAAGNTLEAVAVLMRQRQVRRIPVVEDGHLVGIVSVADIARHLDVEEGTVLAVELARTLAAISAPRKNAASLAAE